MTSVYGGAQAGGANLRFAYEAALQAARELHRLASDFDEATITVAAARADTVVDFLGPMRVQFDDHTTTNEAQLRNLAGELRGLANQLAGDWSAARGEQDRINFARYVAQQKANEGFWAKAWGFVAGEKDYGPPPDNPPPPRGPSFAATRGPLHSPQFGP